MYCVMGCARDGMWCKSGLVYPDPTFFLHAEGKVGSGQLTLSRFASPR